MLVDTHCHIHEADYPLERDEVIERARNAGVTKMICVGTSEKSSREALEFADGREGVYAAIGVHPHDAKDGIDGVINLVRPDSKPRQLAAVGEIGLDYFYSHSPREVQISAFEAQIDLALRLDLPISFHVRNAFSDFWPIFDNFRGVRGVLHSFTDTRQNVEEALKRGLYIGVNGISTFTKDSEQQEMFASLPASRLLLETDAPFLTPVPYRGTINEPVFVREVAAHHARVRGMSLDELSAITTANADALFAPNNAP